MCSDSDSDFTQTQKFYAIGIGTTKLITRHTSIYYNYNHNHNQQDKDIIPKTARDANIGSLLIDFDCSNPISETRYGYGYGGYSLKLLDIACTLLDHTSNRSKPPSSRIPVPINPPNKLSFSLTLRLRLMANKQDSGSGPLSEVVGDASRRTA